MTKDSGGTREDQLAIYHPAERQKHEGRGHCQGARELHPLRVVPTLDLMV